MQNVVQVLDVPSGIKLGVEAFNEAFERLPTGLKTLHAVSYEVKDNYIISHSGDRRVVGPYEQHFLTFETEKDAILLMGMRTACIQNGRRNMQLTFVMPALETDEQKAVNIVGRGLKRLGEIKQKYLIMRVTPTTVMHTLNAYFLVCILTFTYQQDGSKPLPPSDLIDKAMYASSLAIVKDQLNGTKRPGFHGPTLCYFEIIRNKKPVNMADLEAQIKKLYDEECKILCEFAQLRLDGKIDFEFNLP